MLDARPAGGIIFTTIQKFGLLKGEAKHPILCDRSNLIVISDEAHRSQYGLKAKFDKENNIYKYGYAYHLREALPDATFIGFRVFLHKGTKRDIGIFVSHCWLYLACILATPNFMLFYAARFGRKNSNRILEFFI